MSDTDKVHEAIRAVTRALAESALDAVVLADGHGRITEFNTAAELTFGYRRDEVIGRHLAEVLVPPELRDRYAEALRRDLEAAVPRLLGGRVEAVAMRADGSRIPVELSLAKIERAPSPMFAGYVRQLSNGADEDLRGHVRRQEALARLGMQALAGEALDRLLQDAVSVTADTLGARIVEIFELHSEDGLVRRAARGWPTTGVEHGPLPVTADSMPGYAALIEDSVVAEDLEAESRFTDRRLSLGGARGGAAVVVPGPDRPFGVLAAYTTARREFSVDEVFFLQAVANVLAAATQRAKLEDELRYQSALLASQGEADIDGVLVVSADGRILSANRRFADMWGIPLEVMASRSDEAALRSVLDKLVDPDAFLARVAYLYERPDEESREEIRLKDGRTFDRYSAPVKGVDGTHYGRVWFFSDVTRSKRNEDKLRFLANVTEALTWSLDYRETVRRVASLAVPYLGDWCIVYLVAEDGSIERVVLKHADPAMRELARRIASEHRLNPGARIGVPEVIRTGRSQLHPEVTPEVVSGDVVDPERLAAETAALTVRSWICVPLSARGRTFGAISLLTAESGRTYGPEDLSLVEDVARRVALVVDNVRLYQDRDQIARTLQQSLLPPRLPSIPGTDVGARYVPAGEGNQVGGQVGGDFYDVFPTGDRSWCLVIGDVCGKGTEAAARTALARYTVRAVALSERRPSRMLAALNHAMLQESSGESFCTACAVRWKPLPVGARVKLSCAGHPPALVLRKGGWVEPVATRGSLLGVVEQAGLRDRVLQLAPGEAVVLYTDGVLDRRRQGRTFGEERLRAVIGECWGLSADDVAGRIESAALEFGRSRDADDLAILVVRAAPADA